LALRLVLDHLAIGVGILSATKELIFGNQTYNDIVQADSSGSNRISSEDILSAVPDGEEGFGTTSLQFHYNKEDSSFVLE